MSELIPGDVRVLKSNACPWQELVVQGRVRQEGVSPEHFILVAPPAS